MPENSLITASPTEGQWSRWYSENADKIESCLKPALDEVDRTKSALDEMKLDEGQRTKLTRVLTLQDLLDVVSELEEKHKGRKKSQSFQRSLVTFQNFAETYSPFVQALREAPPFGAGHLIWGVCAIVVTTAANKNSKEQTITQSLDKISMSLPRLDVYRELYPTDRMIQLMSQLYAVTLRYLVKVFSYYRNMNWKGSITRILIAMSPSHDAVDPLVSDIDRASQDIKDEGTLGLSAEVRDTRLATQKVQNKVNENTYQIEDLRTRLKDSEERESRVEVSRTKTLFVPNDYDPQEIYEVASRQTNRIDRDTVQVEACQTLLSSLPLLNWKLRPQPSTKTQSNSIPAVSKTLMWVTSSDFDDSTISYAAHDAIKLFLGSDHRLNGNSKVTILHSLYQTSETCCQTDSEDGKRTISSILKEAIYQLLDLHPRLIWLNERLKAHCRGEKNDQLDFEGLGLILRNFLQHATNPPPEHSREARFNQTDETSNEPLPVLWVIDRIDNLRFRGRNAGRLTKLMVLIHEIIQTQRGWLKVLLTSLYDPSRLDDRWVESEDAATIVESDEWIHRYYGVE